MIFIGADPDLHDTAFAFNKGDLWHVTVCSVHKDWKGEDAERLMLSIGYPLPPWLGECAIAVESQQAYSRKSSVDPNALISIAKVSGAIVRHFTSGQIVDLLRIPKPPEWTGGKKKHIQQGHTWTKLGIPFKVHGTARMKERGSAYCIPELPEEWSHNCRECDWKHAGDAVGLALFAADQWKKKKIREKYSDE